jgi:hypothetical protein
VTGTVEAGQGSDAALRPSRRLPIRLFVVLTVGWCLLVVIARAGHQWEGPSHTVCFRTTTRGFEAPLGLDDPVDAADCADVGGSLVRVGQRP